jgi:arylsulfatase A-like enzyme
MFSSDNGPVVDDGYQDQAAEKLGSHKPAGVYRGGKYSIFDGGTRVPWIARWPGHIKPDSVSDAMISQVDLTATLAALSGQKLPDNGAPDSFNEMHALLGESSTGRPYVVEHSQSLAIIEDGWKYIEPNSGQKYNRNSDTETGNDPQPQLYDVREDPGERNNLAAREPARVAQLRSLLDKIKSQSQTRP